MSSRTAWATESQNKKYKETSGYSAVFEYLSGMFEAFSSISDAAGRKGKKRRKKRKTQTKSKRKI